MKLQKKTQQQASIEQQRSGFTIVELLVVIAIIGVLMALLLPAIQSARESGRKTACMSNVYQIAMAMNRYDQDKGKLPGWMKRVYMASDGIDNNANGSVDEANEHVTYSWAPELLPYVERRDVYEQLNVLYADWMNGGIQKDVKISVFLCPSSPPAATNFSPLAYAANTGDMTANKYNGVFPPGDLPNGTSSATNSLEDVADGDGTATTLMVAEKCASNSKGLQGLWSYPGTVPLSPPNPPLIYTTWNSVKTTEFPAEGWSNFGHATSSNTYATPESSHTGGYVVAFCDGHSYFMSFDVAPAVYTQLVTSNNSRSDSPYKAMILDESKY